MPQVSNLSWIWCVLIFLLLYSSMNLLFFFNSILSVKENLYSMETKFTFFFMV